MKTKYLSHQRPLPIEDSPCNAFLPNVSLSPLSYLIASNEKKELCNAFINLDVKSIYYGTIPIRIMNQKTSYTIQYKSKVFTQYWKRLVNEKKEEKLKSESEAWGPHEGVGLWDYTRHICSMKHRICHRIWLLYAFVTDTFINYIYTLLVQFT